MLLMLEDDRDRIDRFSRVAAERQWHLAIARTAPAFVQLFQSLTESPKLIALDHDLFVDNPRDPDPGDGRDVANYLASQRPIAPILIHSSNTVAAESMLLTLSDAGWVVDRIAPIGDDWIESYWSPTVLGMIKEQYGSRDKD